MISKNNDVWLIASRDKTFTGRLANKYPDYNLSTNLFDKKLNDIPGFNILYKYILDNKLLNIIVEFAVYDILVGIYNEQVIVFEVRTDF